LSRLLEDVEFLVVFRFKPPSVQFSAAELITDEGEAGQMEKFLAKHSDRILGVLSGFDRMIFRGCIRQLMFEAGMSMYLYCQGVLLKEFKDFAPYISDELKTMTRKQAEDQRRPFIYLQGDCGSKEKMAREIMERDGISEGLVCVLSTLEPCYSYKVVGNRATEKLEVRRVYTKCLHLYQYWNDPLFGLVHGRIQTWYPFDLQFYINGREFLKNQLDHKNISYKKADNCFTWVSDFAAANELLKKQVSFNWQKTLDKWAIAMNPIFSDIFPMGQSYYWTLGQSEWATDVLFDSAKALSQIYPSLIHHSMVTFKSPDILKFLGKQLTLDEKIHGRFKGEVLSDFKHRLEGVRVKHSSQGNSVKIYDKAGSALRIETTINRPAEFKSFRPKLSTGELEWQSMRKSIDDIPRRAEVSQKINERHLSALATANTDQKFMALIDGIANPIRRDQLRVRGLDPFGKDRKILDTIINGQFHITGFRNRDIRTKLFNSQNPDDIKRSSAKVSRWLRMLRAHGLIKKVPKTHRYLMTERGIQILSALKTIENTTINDLLKLAA